jgi:hypothetical protein
MSKIKRTSNPNGAKKKMIGSGSKIGEEVGRQLAEKIAEENARPAMTIQEVAWRRYKDPKRRRSIIKGAREAAFAVACHPDP